MRQRLLVTVLLLLVGCGDGSGVGTTGTSSDQPRFEVSGFVHAGPVCPVAQNPPDPNCDDRPVNGAVLLVRDANGGEVEVISTADDGVFSVALPAGSYSLIPQPVTGLMGTAGPVELVVDGPVTGIDIAYDTGIR